MVTGPSTRAVISLAPTCRLQWRQAQQGYVLLYPEGMVVLNSSASEILRLCDGSRTLGDIVAELQRCRPGVDPEEVTGYIEGARREGWVRLEE